VFLHALTPCSFQVFPVFRERVFEKCRERLGADSVRATTQASDAWTRLKTVTQVPAGVPAGCLLLPNTH
jgi:hypothetical protein